MIFNDREDLLNRLWSNYSAHKSSVEKSFIYGYLKKRKESKAIKLAASKNELFEYRTKSRRDRYILLRAAYLAHKNEIISETEYSEIFAEISQNKTSGKNSSRDPEKIREQLENKLLKGAAGDFFSNEGFKEGSGGTADNFNGRNLKKVKSRQDGYIDDIELASLFENALSVTEEIVSGSGMDGGISGEISPEYIEKCRRLFLEAGRSGSGYMFIPLHFDTQSGAGIFIIGEDILRNSAGKNCALFILWFFTADMPDDQYGSRYSPPLPLIMNTYECKSIDDAFSGFSDKLNGNSYFEGYAEMNRDTPLKNADLVFSRLLSDPKDIEAQNDFKIIEREKQLEEEEIRQINKARSKFLH